MIPSLFEYPIYFWQLLSGIRSSYEARFAEFRNEDTRKYLKHVQSPEILDLGNGRLRPQFTILKHAGYRVYGVDLASQPRNSTKNFLYVIARYLYNRRSSIQSSSGTHTLVCGDVARLPFKNERFDLITSVAAFEHFLDVPAVISEMERVLRPRGVAWVLIHLFSCLGRSQCHFHSISSQEAAPRGRCLGSSSPAQTLFHGAPQRVASRSVFAIIRRTIRYLETLLCFS